MKASRPGEGGVVGGGAWLTTGVWLVMGACLWIQAMVQEMRPYHTLLLDVAYGSSRSTKASENELLQRLPVDSSVSLHRFVQCLSPFKTLEEIALEMDVSLSQVCASELCVVTQMRATNQQWLGGVDLVSLAQVFLI